MAWSDWDYLGEGIREALDAIRERIGELEPVIETDTDPRLDALYAIDEELLSPATDDRLALSERLERARQAVRQIKALNDGAMSYIRRVGIADALEAAVAAEERNNDPSEPFIAAGSLRC